MCGRIVQSSDPRRFQIVDGIDPLDSHLRTVHPRFNGAPSQELLVIRQSHETGKRSLDLLRWGLIPHWTKAANPRIRPINASSEPDTAPFSVP